MFFGRSHELALTNPLFFSAVYRKAVKIMEAYFSAEEIADSDQLAGMDQGTGAYSFGTTGNMPTSFKFN